jgi:hypothetical protein
VREAIATRNAAHSMRSGSSDRQKPAEPVRRLHRDGGSATLTVVRELSQETVDLVDELHRATRADAAVALLTQIAGTGEPLAVPRIMSLVFDDRPSVAAAAEQVVEALRRRVGLRALGVFDRAFRHRSALRADALRWHRLHAEEVRRLATRPGGRTLVQLATCHPSGHVRQEAIRCCAFRADGSEIPFLLLRANDWVASVAETARWGLRARLGIEHLPDLVAALPMLDEMPRWGRLRGPGILDDIEAALGSRAAVPILLAAASSLDAFVRRGAFRRLLERSPAAFRSVEPAPADLEVVDSSPYRIGNVPDPGLQVAIAALRDADPVIRTRAGRVLLASPDAVFLEYSAPLLASRKGELRVAAAQRFRVMGRVLPWRDLLLDDHAGVRGIAQEAALDADVDPAEEYRRAIPASDGRRLGVCLIGLAETGRIDDALVVRTYLTHRHAVVRHSCLHALARWNPDDIAGLCLTALGDTSGRVVHAARDLLLARVASLRPEEVWARFEHITADHGKCDALTVLAHGGYWRGLPYLLRAFSVSDGPVKAAAAHHLARWFARQHRTFATPPQHSVDEIHAALASPAIPDVFRREVIGILVARQSGPAATR